MTNIEIFIKSLKLTWLRRMLISESKWTRLFTISTGCNVTHLFEFGSDYITRKMKVTFNPFMERNTFIYFLLIRDNKIIYDKGFHTVSELINGQGIFITHENITNDFLLKLPFTVF